MSNVGSISLPCYHEFRALAQRLRETGFCLIPGFFTATRRRSQPPRRVRDDPPPTSAATTTRAARCRAFPLVRRACSAARGVTSCSGSRSRPASAAESGCRESSFRSATVRFTHERCLKMIHLTLCYLNNYNNNNDDHQNGGF